METFERKLGHYHNFRLRNDNNMFFQYELTVKMLKNRFGKSADMYIERWIKNNNWSPNIMFEMEEEE